MVVSYIHNEYNFLSSDLFFPFGGFLSSIFHLCANSEDVGLCKQLNREIYLAAGSVADWPVPTRPSLANELVDKLDAWLEDV